MLRIYLMQLCYNLSDPMMENELIDSIAMRRFARLGGLDSPTPDETTILNFRHLIEKHELSEAVFDLFNRYLKAAGIRVSKGTIVDATIISAPGSIKNKSKERDPEMKHTKKGNQYYFGAKAHIGVDAKSGLVHSVIITGANVADINMADNLVRERDKDVYGDAGYQGLADHQKMHGKNVFVAMGPGKRRLLPSKSREAKAEFKKSQIRAKVEHAFHYVKCVFGYAKVRYRGLYKNAQRLFVLFGLANLCKSKNKLLTLKA